MKKGKCRPVKEDARRNNGFGMAVGILFVAVLLLAGSSASQAVNHGTGRPPLNKLTSILQIEIFLQKRRRPSLTEKPPFHLL